MAVILAASDETYRDKFVYGGLLATVKYWEKIFRSQMGSISAQGSAKFRVSTHD